MLQDRQLSAVNSYNKKNDGKKSALETRVPGSDLRHLHVLKADDNITRSEVDVALCGQATFHPHFDCQDILFVVLQGHQRACIRSSEGQHSHMVQV